MTSVNVAEGSPEMECCGGVGIQTAISSVGRQVTAAWYRFTGWLSLSTGRVRDAVERVRDERRLSAEEGCCPAAVGRLMEAARPALDSCRQVVGRRVTEAYGSCRPGTTRLRESMGFWRAVLAEFVGTFFLVVIGCGSATEQTSYSPAKQQQQDRAVRMAIAFGMVIGQ